MDLRSSRPDRATTTKYASTMPIQPNSYTSPVRHRGEYADSLGRGSRTGYESYDGPGWSPYDGRRSATATMTAFSDGGHSGVEEEEEESSWYRRGEGSGQQRRRRRRQFEPTGSFYPEYDYYGARHQRPLSSLFDEVVQGARNRLRGRSARPRPPVPYQPAVHDIRGDAVPPPNDVEQEIAAPIPRRPSVARPPSRSTMTDLNNGSAHGSRSHSAAASLHRPEPTPIQPVLEPVIPTKFSPSPPSPPPLGALASFTTFLRTLRALPMITPNSFSSRGERAPITLTYTPSLNSDRSFAQMSEARRKGMIRYGRRGEWEGEVEKGESWYVMSGAQEARAARRAVRQSIRKQEKEKRKTEKEIEDGLGERTGQHHRSNTLTSMAYSYSHGPQAIPPPRPSSTSTTTSRAHERRPTVSSQHTRVASPPPSYQTHTTVMPTPYGVVPVTYASYGGYPTYGYGYPVYAPPSQQQPQPPIAPVVPPPPQPQPTRRLSGSSASGRSQRSRSSRRHSLSRAAQSRSRHGSDEEGSIVPIPASDLPPDVKAAVSIEALNQA